MTTDPQVAKKGRKAAATRERLLEAARDTFAEIGYPATRVADIVARAGTSHGTFYTYFTDKKDALLALTEEIARDLYGTKIAPLAGNGEASTPQSLIRPRMRAFLDAYSADWRFVRAWIEAGALHPEIDEVRWRIQDSLSETLARFLQQEQERGLIPADVDVHVAAVALSRMTESTAYRWLASGRELDDHLADQLALLWVRALYRE